MLCPLTMMPSSPVQIRSWVTTTSPVTIRPQEEMGVGADSALDPYRSVGARKNDATNTLAARTGVLSRSASTHRHLPPIPTIRLDVMLSSHDPARQRHLARHDRPPARARVGRGTGRSFRSGRLAVLRD